MTKAKKKFATHVTLPSGRRVYVSGKTKAELNEKVAQARLESGVGVDVGNTVRFEDYARTWLKVYKEPKLRPNSYTTVKTNLENHVLPFFSGILIRDIKPLHIQMFLSSISDLSQSTQKKCWHILGAILRTAAENGIIMKSPISKETGPAGEPPKDVEPLSCDQARALLDATRGTRVYTFCLIALTTGLRRGEILGLMWEDINLKTGILTVQHNKTFPANENDAPVTTLLKTEAAHRRIPLPDVLRTFLEQERKRSSSPYVLSMENGQSLTRASFRRMWSAIDVRTVTDERPLGSTVSGGRDGPIRVSLDFTCHPHQLRHTCITQWVESGLDVKRVQYLAGHSTLEMTLKIYTHYRRKAKEPETAAMLNAASEYLVG